MAAQLFSIKEPDGTKISGDLVEAQIVPIFSKGDTLAQLGLIYPAPAGKFQQVRIPAPLRIFAQDYVFSVNDSGMTPDTPQVDLNLIEMNKTAYTAMVSETLDQGLWSQTGQIRASVITSIAEAYADTMLVDYLTELDRVLKVNKATNMLVLPAKAMADDIDRSTAHKVVKQVQAIIRQYRQTITKHRKGLPNDQIRLLGSYEYIDALANAYAVLGYKPEYIENKYVEGTKTLSVNGMEITPFYPLGTNITAQKLHKTKKVDMTNYHLIAITRFVLPMIKGNLEIFANKLPVGNNFVNGAKGYYGYKLFDVFQKDVFGIVKAKPV